MKAMILAAGLGVRLRPLTNDRPKALVEIGSRTLLEITLSRLRALGVRDVIINVYYFADRILEYLENNRNFGINIEISREETLLDTGGGLKKAAYFFLNDSAGPEEPFLLHNVDVISTIDLERMLRFHVEKRALATLAVQNRQTNRYLLFNEQLELCGRRSDDGQKTEMARPSEEPLALAFSGIHVISPRLLEQMSEEGAFSIITTYLRLAAAGERIQAFRADEYYWRDVGRPEDLALAAQEMKQQAFR